MVSFHRKMCSSPASGVAFLLLLAVVVVDVASAEASQSQIPWKTLSGKQPLVIARGGFSGLFPDSSTLAYELALKTSVPGVIPWCDIQLTQDGFGICFPTLKLQNASNIAQVYIDEYTVYNVNGMPIKGWFPVDYTLLNLQRVSLYQEVYYRTTIYDGHFPILTPEDLAKFWKPPGLWLNFQYPTFYGKHNLSMRSFVLSVSKSIVISYISLPEVNFLRGITARFNPSDTKLVFRFIGKD